MFSRDSLIWIGAGESRARGSGSPGVGAEIQFLGIESSQMIARSDHFSESLQFLPRQFLKCTLTLSVSWAWVPIRPSENLCRVA